MTVKLSLHDMNPVAINMPQRATLEVVETEPVTKGQTASSSYKPAILRTVCVPRCRRMSARNTDRGHDRGRVLRRARQGLGTGLWASAPGGDALGTRAVRFVTRLLAAFLAHWPAQPSLAPRNSGRLDLGRARRMARGARSVPQRDQHPAGDRLRLRISGQRRLPAYDPRAMPALVQLNAVPRSSSTVSGAARCRCCCRSTPQPFSCAKRTARRRPSLSRFQADFRPADLFHAGLAGYDAVFSLRPAPAKACRDGLLPNPSRCRSPARC